MKFLRYIFSGKLIRILCLLFTWGFSLFPASAQVKKLSPFLVSSGGGYGEVEGHFSISYSIGEPIISTGRNPSSIYILTQGFQQPLKDSIYLSVITSNATCKGADNGSITITPHGGIPPYSYSWLILSGKQSSEILSKLSGSSISDLYTGTYVVKVTDNRNVSVVDTIYIAEDQYDCDETLILHIYSGFTPNGDGVNDTWQIDNIEHFHDNHVSVFNRWGEKVWETAGYDNDNVFWDGNNQEGLPLPSGTYFYVIRQDKKVDKGWVELTR